MSSKNNKIFFSGNTWHHQAKIVDYHTFTINYVIKSGFASEEAALKSFDKYKKQYEKDIARVKKMTDIKYTFTEYLDYWYQNLFAPYSNGSAKVGFAWAIYKIIFPCVKKDLLISRVTGTYLNDILDTCKDFCTSAAPMAKKVINVALKDAAADHYISRNPVSEVKEYPWKIPKITVLNKKQLKALLQEAYTYHTVYLEILLALFCGLRIGEIRGLKYEDFDPIRKTLSIKRQYTNDYEVVVTDSEDYKAVMADRYLKPPKTLNSYRILKVPDVIFRELEIRRKDNERIFEKYPQNKALFEDFVCISCYGKIISDGTVLAALKRIVRRSGISEKVTVHGLRHMFASILIEQNVPLEEISKMMGHAHENTTFNLYCGIMDANGEIQNTIGQYMDPITYIKEIS